MSDNDTTDKVNNSDTQESPDAVSETQAEKPQSDAPKSENGIGAFKRRYSERKQKKARERNSTELEIFCFVIIIVFASYFKPWHYRGQTNSLLYYYEDANVLSNEIVSTDDGDRWQVKICYSVGGQDHYRFLYYKKNPAYEAGDVITLKIQTLNPDNIEVEGMKR